MTQRHNLLDTTKIPVQGILTDSSGIVLDGDQSITFTLYDLDENGNQIWTSNVQSITLDNGEFSYLLGEGEDLDSSLIDTGIPLYLEVKVGSDILSPRMELGVHLLQKVT